MRPCPPFLRISSLPVRRTSPQRIFRILYDPEALFPESLYQKRLKRISAGITLP
jgi:hypothetical protein